MKTVIPTKCFHDLHVLIVDLVMINVAEFMAFFEMLQFIIPIATFWKARAK